MSTIAYDLPVLDLIDELSATGHVTHTQHRKDKVTLHHNGGRLSHGGVLSVWQVRPASAHFNIDGPGTCAQYVRATEYAWACGSTLGNQQSISIEMCNETVGPEWRVGEATWRSAARLAGWLFARIIGERPNSSNLVPHGFWSPTACPGPFINGNWNAVLSLAQQWYDRFVNGGDDMIPEGEWRTVRDQVANMSPGKSGGWGAGQGFIEELAWRNAVTASLNAQNKVLLQIAEDDSNTVALDPAQFAALRTDLSTVGEGLEDKLDEALANLQIETHMSDEDFSRIGTTFRNFLYNQMFVATPKPQIGT